VKQRGTLEDRNVCPQSTSKSLVPATEMKVTMLDPSNPRISHTPPDVPPIVDTVVGVKYAIAEYLYSRNQLHDNNWMKAVSRIITSLSLTWLVQRKPREPTSRLVSCININLLITLVNEHCVTAIETIMMLSLHSNYAKLTDHL
jgi:hypothetical protein